VPVELEIGGKWKFGIELRAVRWGSEVEGQQKSIASNGDR
jgi:hypothetical protein